MQSAFVAIAVWLVMAGYRWITYQRKLSFLRHYEKAFEHFWGQGRSKEDLNTLLEGRQAVKALVREAGTDQIQVPIVQLAGYGHVATGHMQPFDNPTANYADVVTMNSHALSMTIGYFRHRRNQSFDPMFWIDTVLNLPKHALPVLEKAPNAVQQVVRLVWYGALLASAYRAGTWSALTSAFKEILGAK
jgi:hypothetical protein